MSASHAAERSRSWSSGSADAMKIETLKAIQAARAERRAVALATRIGDGLEALIYPDTARGDLVGDGSGAAAVALIDAARRAFVTGRNGAVETPNGPVFVHVYNPPPRLIVVGAVHIAQALAPMASMMGFDVTVVDPRRAFATGERFPNVHVTQDWPDEALENLKPDAATAIVTLTHDPKLDDPALEAALKSPAFYVGALGSRRTHAKRKERLAEAGIDDRQFARVHGPVGLAIGAKSPAEIAVSILAQIVDVKAKLAEQTDAAKAA